MRAHWIPTINGGLWRTVGTGCRRDGVSSVNGGLWGSMGTAM